MRQIITSVGREAGRISSLTLLGRMREVSGMARHSGNTTVVLQKVNQGEVTPQMLSFQEEGRRATHNLSLNGHGSTVDKKEKPLKDVVLHTMDCSSVMKGTTGSDTLQHGQTLGTSC